MKNEITSIKAREIIDSRGNPTVEATVTLADGNKGVASAPSGASTGKYEAHELRDGDEARYGGKGVLRAIKNVNERIARELIGMPADNQREIDEKMIIIDGTDNKKNLGANATLAVSLAVAKASAKSNGRALYRELATSKTALPSPMFNILNGGKHASNNVEIQEFMIVPRGLTFTEAVRCGSEIYHTLGKLLGERGLAQTVGDEGGYAPNLKNDEEALELLCMSIEKSGYTTDTVGIALDAAASEWQSGKTYKMTKRNQTASAEDLIVFYEGLAKKFPLISIEDGLGDDDITGWQNLTKKLGGRLMLVGDDLFVTNKKRLSMGISHGIGNTILIKPNQIGTLTETMDVISLAKSHGYGYIISHRSGETEDTSIADIAVASGAAYIKAGAPCRSERTAKYNRLMEIENELLG